MDGDGVGNFTIRVERRQNRNINSADGDFASSGQFTSEDEFEKVKEWKELAVDPDTGPLQDTAAENGYIKTQNVAVAPDDTWDVTTTWRESQAVDPNVQTKEIGTYVTTEVTTATTATARETQQGAQVLGKIVETRSEQSPFQERYNNVETKRTAHPQDDVAQKVINKFETTTTDTDRNQIIRVDPQESHSDGTIVTTRSSKNDFGRFDNSKETRTAREQASVRNDLTRTAYETDDVATARNAENAEAEEELQTAGVIKTSSSVLNDFGLFDNSLRTRTAALDVVDDNIFEVDAYESRDTDVTRNQAERIDEVTSQAVGSVTQTRSSKNDFGLFDNSATTRTAATDVTDDSVRVVTEFVDTNLDVTRNHVEGG